MRGAASAAAAGGHRVLGGVPSGAAAVVAAALLVAPVGPRVPVELRATASQVFRSRVDLIYVTATVRDPAGRLVAGLERDDFEVLENGRPQPVTYFSRERVPVSLGLVLDVSDSMRGERIDDARRAMTRFLEDLLVPGDEAFVVAFNHRPTVLAEWTSSLVRLSRHLRDLRPFGGTAIYDALLAAEPLTRVRTHQRAAIVVVSDGADTASSADLRTVRTRLRQSDVLLYALALDSARRTRLNDAVNPYALREMTDWSGGYTELVRDSSELAPATARIAEELNHQYTLAYAPPRPFDDSYRRIRVKVAGAEFLVRARRGYVATAGGR